MKLLSIMLLATVLVVAGCQTDEFEEPVEEIEPPEPVEEETEEVIEEEVEETEEVVEETEDSRVIEVEGYGRTFEPDTIDVEVGETIEFIFSNTGGTHDFVIPELGVGTEVISEGETDSFTYTFEEAGTIDFECSVGNHAAEGMVGEIIVS